MFSWPDVRRALPIGDVYTFLLWKLIASGLLLVLQAKEVAEQVLVSGLDAFELLQFKAAVR